MKYSEWSNFKEWCNKHYPGLHKQYHDAWDEWLVNRKKYDIIFGVTALIALPLVIFVSVNRWNDSLFAFMAGILFLEYLILIPIYASTIQAIRKKRKIEG